MKTLQILQQERHFLYLPLYYAHHMDYFGYIPAAKIEIVNSSEHVDEAVYNRLMSPHIHRNDKVAFAVVDPAYALRNPQVGHLTSAILGGLITNAAFWAVDRSHRRLTHLEELSSYDKIISFKPGSTSYGIAKRIFGNRTNGDENIIKVDPGRELIALTQNPPGTIALSPDILEITYLTVNPVYSVEMTLGTTPDYSNVLVTAIVSRKDIIENYREVAFGLIKALQHSLIHIKLGLASVEIFAHEYFLKESEVVRTALNAAAAAQVYPSDLGITETNWLQAARAAAYTDGASFDAEAERRARECYNMIVTPYEEIPRRAWQEVLTNWSPEPAVIPKQSNMSILAVIAYSGMVLLGGLMAQVGGWKLFLSSTGLVLIFSILEHLSVLKAKKVEIIINRLLVCISLIIVLLGFLLAWSNDVIISIIVGVILGGIGIFVNIMVRDK